MGRAGIRRRKPARHLPKASGTSADGAFGTEHSAYTVEGTIEGVGNLARGANRASPRQWRLVGWLLAAAIAALVVLFAVLVLLDIN